MTFVFWQGIISIHQKAFLEALARQPSVTKVILAVEKDITASRRNMGWTAPHIEGVEVALAPDSTRIRQIIASYDGAVHTMGGVRPGGMITEAFEECIRRGCRIGIMTEPYNHAGMRGLLRGVKYRYYRVRHGGDVQFILAIGRQGVQQFADIGFAKQSLFPWAYFISMEGAGGLSHGLTGAPVKILYAGRLEEAKGISRFVQELTGQPNDNYTMDIYGEGPDEAAIQQLAAAAGGRVRVSPFVKHEDLITRYPDYDWVVLPSSGKDGWGAIVSEGLLCGLKAICSNICGASWVVKPGWNGVVFDWARPGDCGAAITAMLAGDAYATPADIASWAAASISGEAGAAYFMRIMDCVYANKERPQIPWH